MRSIIKSDGNKCPICGCLGINIHSSNGVFSNYYCYTCPNCGEYFAADDWSFCYIYDKAGRSIIGEEEYDVEKLRSYLFYNKGEKRPYLTSEEKFSVLNKEDFVKIYNLTPAMVDAWYPQTFAEKADKILCKIHEMGKYDGAYVSIEKGKKELFFCQNKHSEGVHEGEDIRVQMNYMYNFLDEAGYLLSIGGDTVQLTPKALERIYELQRKQINNKNVFVAMSFAGETASLRKVLKQAILKAGYFPILIDEVQYNGQIVPEMLYQIRESRFVIAELSHHNNGAYYEAGYALGLGKEVIHICEEEAMGSKLHFDVKQVNTITYKADDLDGLKERLIKRIQATIK